MSKNVLVQSATFCLKERSSTVNTQFIVDIDKLPVIREREKEFLRNTFNINEEDEPVINGKKKEKVHVFFSYKDINGDPIDHFGIPPSRINIDVVPLNHGDRSVLKMTLSRENVDEVTLMMARSNMINFIFNEVCRYFNLEKHNIVNNVRLRKYSIPRQLITYFLYRYRSAYKMTLTDIANLFNQKAHASILHNVKEIEIKSEVEKETKAVKDYFQEIFDAKFKIF